jgi:hypothetical protein
MSIQIGAEDHCVDRIPRPDLIRDLCGPLVTLDYKSSGIDDDPHVKQRTNLFMTSSCRTLRNSIWQSSSINFPLPNGLQTERLANSVWRTWITSATMHPRMFQPLLMEIIREIMRSSDTPRLAGSGISAWQSLQTILSRISRDYFGDRISGHV